MELIELPKDLLILASNGFEDYKTPWEWEHQYSHLFAMLIKHSEKKEEVLKAKIKSNGTTKKTKRN